MFLALYVVAGVIRRAKLRCELEHHSHDVYDAFQSVHAKMVQRRTHFRLEEMIALIEAAHQQSGDDREMCPAVGHDVKVSNLFSVRDFWEWLALGYTDPSTRSYDFPMLPSRLSLLSRTSETAWCNWRQVVH